MSEQTQLQQQESDKPTQSYISRVRLKGYKSIIDTEVTFKPGLNIIIGANGSGKTNFVEFLAKLLERSIIEDPFDCSAEIQLRNVEEELIEYSVQFEVIKIRGISSPISRASRNEYIIANGVKTDIKDDLYALQIFDSLAIIPTYITFGITDEFLVLKNSLRLTVIVHDTPSYSMKVEPKATFSLQVLVLSFLLPLQTSNHFAFLGEFIEELQAILYLFKNNIKNFTPVKDIRISKSLENLSKENNLSFDYIKIEFLLNNQWITWNQLSDGTKRIFYIITEVTFAKNVILLEEPELGIHPDQLRKLMSFLREQAEEKQIIITTHSPQVLNALKSDELDRIIVARHEKEAGTKLYHLTAEEMEHARGYMKDEGLFLSDYWVYSGFEKEEEEAV